MKTAEKMRLKNRLLYLQAQMTKIDALPERVRQTKNTQDKLAAFRREVGAIEELLAKSNDPAARFEAELPEPPAIRDAVWPPTGNTKPARSLDPRPDLPGDSERWNMLLWQLKSKGEPWLWGVFHALRCGGARITGDNLALGSSEWGTPERQAFIRSYLAKMDADKLSKEFSIDIREDADAGEGYSEENRGLFEKPA